VHRDYKRTEREIEEALEKARQASEALTSLTQDLRSFNLQDYLNFEGKFTLVDLKQFIQTAILRLGGAILPNGELFKIETPKVLQKSSNVLPKYELVAFDRDVAMRKRAAELFGLGHPLVEAIIENLKRTTFPGDITILKRNSSEDPYAVLITLLSVDLDNGNKHQEIKILRVNPSGDVRTLHDEWLLRQLERKAPNIDVDGSRLTELDWDKIRQGYEGAIGAILTQIKLSLENPVGARVRLLGVLGLV
ncbi:MAG: hypothetical protein ACE5HI_16910, partial [bacterium]